MLEDFYLYATVVNEDRETKMERCDITRYVSEILFLFYEEIEKNFGKPELQFPDHDIYVFAADNELKRVLQNIVQNALRHGTAYLGVAVLEQNDKVQIRIENKSAEPMLKQPQQVFERSFKGDTSRTNGGTGLGLCIAKELVERMGGMLYRGR